MADILIRGMEMPHDCPHCEFAAFAYASPMSSDCTLYCRAADKFKDCATEVLKDKPYEVIKHYNDRPDWCPLVPLPEKHGRLIDADKLMEKGVRMSWSVQKWVQEVDIMLAHTIIEAEGGEADGN